MYLQSDSYMTGWGVVFDLDLQTGVHWSVEEQENHINFLELFAAFSHYNLCVVTNVTSIFI